MAHPDITGTTRWLLIHYRHQATFRRHTNNPLICHTLQSQDSSRHHTDNPMIIHTLQTMGCIWTPHWQPDHWSHTTDTRTHPVTILTTRRLVTHNKARTHPETTLTTRWLVTLYRPWTHPDTTLTTWWLVTHTTDQTQDTPRNHTDNPIIGHTLLLSSFIWTSVTHYKRQDSSGQIVAPGWLVISYPKTSRHPYSTITIRWLAISYTTIVAPRPHEKKLTKRHIGRDVWCTTIFNTCNLAQGV